jgi:hypothetical protein
MEQVFHNIKHRSGSVNITIYDNPDKGNLGYWSGHRLSTNIGPMSIKCYGWKDFLKFSPSHITYRTAETFEHTVYAARRANCQISCLKMDLFTYYNPYAQAQAQQAMEEVLQSNPDPLSVKLGHAQCPQLSYNRRLESVELKDVVYSGTAMGAGFNLLVDALYAWLERQQVARLKVELIDNYTQECLAAMFTPHLEYLDFSRMCAQTGQFDRDLWSETLSIIADLPNLKRCRLSQLTYAVDTTWSDDHKRYFELPGHGRYLCEVPGFKLLFPNGMITTEVEGDNICKKLYDLAHYVRAEENKKRRKIISDDGIQDDIVGIVHRIGQGP